MSFPVSNPLGLARDWLRLGLLATVLAAGAAALHSPARDLWRRGGRLPGEITLTEARQHPGPLLWLDARPAAAFAADHIPEALPLNEDDWDHQIEAVLLRWQPDMRVIVYCNDSACATSHHVAERLRRSYGLTDTCVLHGGWPVWRKAQAP